MNTSEHRYRDIFNTLIRASRQKPSVRTFLEFLLTLAVCVAFSFFAIRPTAVTIIDLTKEINRKEEVILEMDDKIESIRIGQDRFLSLTKTLEIINQGLTTTPNAVYFAKGLDGVLGSTQTTNSSYKIGPVEIKGGVENTKTDFDTNAFNFSLNFSGTYAQTIQTIKLSQNLWTPVILDKISIYKKVDGLSAQVEGQIVYLSKKI